MIQIMCVSVMMTLHSNFNRYQAQLYSYPDCSESTIESLEESLFVNITKHKSFIRYMLRPDTLIRNSKNVLQKKKKGQPATFTDNVGWSMEETFLENVSYQIPQKELHSQICDFLLHEIQSMF